MGADARACAAFRRAWCSPGPPDYSTAGADTGAGGWEAGCGPPGHPYPGCAYLGGAFRHGKGGATADDDWRSAAWAHAGGRAVERLWLARYHVAAQLLRRRVNVLMSDLDGALDRKRTLENHSRQQSALAI